MGDENGGKEKNIMKNEKILIIEDDIQIRNFINYALKKEGFHVSECESGEEALKLVARERIDMMLLDLGLPGMDGMEVLRTVRTYSNVPVIIISARGEDEDKVAALDYGADDYLTKPFSTAELLARIRVGFRHYNQSIHKEKQNIYHIGDIRVNLEGRIVLLKGEQVHLTPMEYDLLTLFMENAGMVLTKSFLMERLYGKNCGEDTQALRTLIAGLRRKIEETPAEPKYIMTESGVGYRIKV